MLLRSSLGKFLGPATALVTLASIAGGCGGCDGPETVCDAHGNCEICDAYGCVPADPDSGGSQHGSGGSGPSGTGGSGGSGAGAPCDDELTTCPCTEGADCDVEGTRCVEGLCIVGCDFSYQCGPDKVCANGACVAGCDDQTPCATTGTVCANGVCVVDSTNPQCDETTPCPANDVCVGGLCEPPCATNAECAEDEICDAGSGACIPDPSPQPVCGGALACTGLQQCGADGYCHYPCQSLDECEKIAAQFVACDGVCKTQAEVDPECSLDAPCPAGQDCISNTCL